MSIIENFSDFFGATKHFRGKNGALRWSILVGKQKYNVQMESGLRPAEEKQGNKGNERERMESLCICFQLKFHSAHFVGL